MPNNDDYVEEFNLPGKVTFSAENVSLIPESVELKSTAWVDGTLECTYMPVDSEGTRAINLKGEGGGYCGSKFQPGAPIAPFEVYISGGDSRRAIPIFGGSNGVDRLPTLSSSMGIVVETPAQGTIRVSSSRACRVAVVTPEGAVIRTLNLSAGESQTVEGLTRGLYIVGGAKVMVR